MYAEDLWHPSVRTLIALLDNSPNAVFICSKDKHLLYVNQAYESINSVKASEIVGKTLFELTDMGFLETSIGLLVLESKRATSIIQRIHNGNKELFVMANPVLDENGEPELVIGISIDMEKLSQERWELLKNRYISPEKASSNLIIAESSAMKNIVNLAYRVAQTKASVLIQGESGVGKDVLARFIHESSPMKEGRLVSVNCAAIPESLLESELFGYEAGAFTGAKAGGKAGIFEMANGGTLFLDEVGDLPMALQPKLLRALEDQTIMRLGGTKPISLHFRLITATNQDLKQKVTEGMFREDLFFRMAVLTLYIPPLRDRPEDIIALANYFLASLNMEYKSSKYLSSESMRALQAMPWKGNVRELKNCIERATVLSESDRIGPGDLQMTSLVREADPMDKGLFNRNMEDLEKELVLGAYKRYHSTRKAAEELGMSQSRFARKLMKYRDTEKE